MRKLTTLEDYKSKRLKDLKFAMTYLDVALEEYEKDKDSNMFLMAIRDVVEAQGGLNKLAKNTKLNRQNLYKALSARGNPEFFTIETILHCLGFRLSVQPIKLKR